MAFSKIFLSLGVLIFLASLIYAAIIFTKGQPADAYSAYNLRQQAIAEAQKNNTNQYEYSWSGILPPMGR